MRTLEINCYQIPTAIFTTTLLFCAFSLAPGDILFVTFLHDSPFPSSLSPYLPPYLPLPPFSLVPPLHSFFWVGYWHSYLLLDLTSFSYDWYNFIGIISSNPFLRHNHPTLLHLSTHTLKMFIKVVKLA